MQPGAQLDVQARRVRADHELEATVSRSPGCMNLFDPRLTDEAVGRVGVAVETLSRRDEPAACDRRLRLSCSRAGRSVRCRRPGGCGVIMAALPLTPATREPSPRSRVGRSGNYREFSLENDHRSCQCIRAELRKFVAASTPLNDESSDTRLRATGHQSRKRGQHGWGNPAAWTLDPVWATLLALMDTSRPSICHGGTWLRQVSD